MTSDHALALVHQGWGELKRQRPLAAWSCWQRSLRIDPQGAAAPQAIEMLAQSPVLPEAARVSYRFRPPRSDRDRARWQAAQVHTGRDLTDLGEAADYFRGLTRADGDELDTAACYNVALCLAWMGQNADAVGFLDRVVQQDASRDFPGTVSAWVLAEVLRHGAGAEELADDLSHSGSLPWSVDRGDPASLVPEGCLRRLPVAFEVETGPATEALPQQPFEWLDRPLPVPSQALKFEDLPRVLVSMIVQEGRLRFSSPDRESFDRFTSPGVGQEDHLARIVRGGQPVWEATQSILPLNLLDAAVWTFRLPPGLDEPTRQRLAREAVEDYYENRWVFHPRKGLGASRSSSTGHANPIEAAERASQGDDVARAKLTAIIDFREQLARRPAVAALYAGYPFDRLRRRLGLEQLDPGTVEARDYDCMSRQELIRLDPATLQPPELLAACRSAYHLHDRALAARFASHLVQNDPTALARNGPPWLFELLEGRE